jgi:hypothetical protein
MTGLSSEKCATLRVPSVNSWTCAANATAAIAPIGRPAASLRGTVLPQASAPSASTAEILSSNLEACCSPCSSRLRRRPAAIRSTPRCSSANETTMRKIRSSWADSIQPMTRIPPRLAPIPKPHWYPEGSSSINLAGRRLEPAQLDARSSQWRCRQEFRQVSNPLCLALPLLRRNYHGASATVPGHGLRSLGPGPRNHPAEFCRWLRPQSNFAHSARILPRAAPTLVDRRNMTPPETIHFAKRPTVMRTYRLVFLLARW